MRHLFLVAIVVLSLFLSAFNSSPHRSYKVEIINKSDMPVSILMDSVARHYSLYIPAGETREYKLKGGVYEHGTLACDKFASGIFELGKKTRLVFTSCYDEAVNQGEPSIEKVHFYDSPHGFNWYYKFHGLDKE